MAAEAHPGPGWRKKSELLELIKPKKCGSCSKYWTDTGEFDSHLFRFGTDSTANFGAEGQDVEHPRGGGGTCGVPNRTDVAAWRNSTSSAVSIHSIFYHVLATISFWGVDSGFRNHFFRHVIPWVEEKRPLSSVSSVTSSMSSMRSRGVHKTLMPCVAYHFFLVVDCCKHSFDLIFLLREWNTNEEHLSACV